MFDGLGHELPFIATNLPFFKEFSSKGWHGCQERVSSDSDMSMH
jgi:hypothetical protein